MYVLSGGRGPVFLDFASLAVLTVCWNACCYCATRPLGSSYSIEQPPQARDLLDGRQTPLNFCYFNKIVGLGAWSWRRVSICVQS